MKDKYGVKKAFLFLGYIAKHKELYKQLRRSGFELVFKPVVKREGIIKGNVDAELVPYTSVIEFQSYDKAVIVTGDGDFCCLIKFLNDRNKLLKLMIPNYLKYSSLLRRFAKDTVFLNNLRNKLSRQQLKRGINLRTKHFDSSQCKP